MVVAEVTQPSLGVGYELGRAVALNKRILCLFRPQSGRGEHSKPWMATPSLPSFLRTQPSAPSLGPLSTVPTHKKGGGRERKGGSMEGRPLHLPPPLLVLSAMIRGAADGLRFQVWDYEEGEVEAMLDRYFEADPSEEVAASPEPTA